MSIKSIKIVTAILFVSAVGALPAVSVAAAQAQSASAQSGITRRIGAIKAINGSTITLTPDSGPEVAVTPQANARIVRIAPGEKDLKNATPISLSDLQVGDRVLVGGKLSDDSTSLAASSIVVMKASDVEARQQQTRQDWQKRGMGGLVESVDAAGGTVTVSIPSLAGKKTIAVHASATTVVRRYALDSIKFEDAKPSTLKEVQPGDQLRARGERSADGAQFTAEEIVTGTFPYIVGTVKSVDASAGTLSVQDILSKKTLEVKTTADSQLHKIPAEMAQRFAARLKGTMPAGMPGAAGSSSSSAPSGSNSQSSQAGAPSGGAASSGGGMGGGMRAGGPPDFQSILSRLPSSTLADLQLQKGDAVVILATAGTPSTAITLLSGVEPILQAAPNAGQAMMLAPWNLGGAPGGDAGSQ
jgi:co-chaperonin GroES (HSP10)